MEWVALALVLIAVLLTVLAYNRLVAARNGYRNAFAQIDVQLTRRYDLIPNLVKTAERYMVHERETLDAVTRARNQALGHLRELAADPANGVALQALAQSEQGLAGALGRLFALSEAYPDLKANQNMLHLSEELVSTENRVAFARQAYNDAVMLYNNQAEVFPNHLVARLFGFAPARPLEIGEVARREAVRVDFR